MIARLQFSGKAFCGRILPIVVAATSGLLVVLASPSKALDGSPASFHSGQVRICIDGVWVGTGTLVDREWVLTARHVVDDYLDGDDLDELSVRFGVLKGEEDSPANLRNVDGIRQPPQRGDIALIHLDRRVPSSVWFPRRVADRDPGVRSVNFLSGSLFGWREEDETLVRSSTTIYSDAIENADRERALEAEEEEDEDERRFSNDFPKWAGVEPIILPDVTNAGDSGAGFFIDETLTGVHSGKLSYQHRYVDDEGEASWGDDSYASSTVIPVWPYWNWIDQTARSRGARARGGSANAPGRGGHGGGRHGYNRKGPESTNVKSGKLLMTLPPQDRICDPGDTRCNFPPPTRKLAYLVGSRLTPGTGLARCATAFTKNCSFGGVSSPAGIDTRLQLGTANPGREVMAWCKTTQVPIGGAPRPVLRVSFTNSDHRKFPAGYGWWDVAPDQLTTAPTSRAPVSIDVTQFATCGPNPTDSLSAIDCHKITIKSAATDQYISAEWENLNKLEAKGGYSTADTFTACYHAPGYYTLFSWANRKYVTAELGASPGDDSYGTLEPRASKVGAWEKFTINFSPSSLFEIQLQANGKYVTSDALNTLHARIAYPGPRESWDIQSEPRIHPSQAVNYVALGDSYSSGVGAEDYDTASGSCKRSINAYPQRWVKDFSLEPVTAFTFTACAGAKIADVESKQLGSLGQETTMVTMSIGGNDVGFEKIVTACLANNIRLLQGNACNQAIRDVEKSKRWLPKKLNTLYEKIQEKAPNAQVFIFGYPRILELGDCGFFSFSDSIRRNMAKATSTLNGIIRDVAIKNGFTFIDGELVFKGHGVCSHGPDGPWITDIRSIFGAYHPTRDGQDAYAAALEAAMEGTGLDDITPPKRRSPMILAPSPPSR